MPKKFKKTKGFEKEVQTVTHPDTHTELQIEFVLLDCLGIEWWIVHVCSTNTWPHQRIQVTQREASRTS